MEALRARLARIEAQHLRPNPAREREDAMMGERETTTYEAPLPSDPSLTHEQALAHVLNWLPVQDHQTRRRLDDGSWLDERTGAVTTDPPYVRTQRGVQTPWFPAQVG